MADPYAPLFRNSADQLVAWIGVLSILAIAGIRNRRRSNSAQDHLVAIGRSLLVFGELAFATFLIGAVGAWLEVRTFVWFFWQLASDLVTVAVFQVFPILIFIVLIWGITGKLFGSYSIKVLRLPLAAAVLEGVNVGLYFVVCKLME